MTEKEKQDTLQLLELSRANIAGIASQDNQNMQYFKDIEDAKRGGGDNYRLSATVMRSSQDELSRTEAAIEYINRTPAAQLTMESINKILERRT